MAEHEFGHKGCKIVVTPARGMGDSDVWTFRVTINGAAHLPASPLGILAGPYSSEIEAVNHGKQFAIDQIDHPIVINEPFL
jgi:hypothetical protein